jgi:hypothetical protein
MVGSTIAFECIIENLQKSQVSEMIEDLKFMWYKNNAPVNEKYVQRFGNLMLRNLKESDSGEYYCKVKNTRTNTESNTGYGSLTVRRGPQQPLSVRVSPKQVDLYVGDDFTIDCIVSGSTSSVVTWARVDGSLDPYYQTKVGNKLVIKNAQLEHSGRYECLAQAGYSKYASDQVKVTVKPKYIPPRVQIINKNQYEGILNKGVAIKLYCRIVDGTPTPSLEWKRTDDRPLPTNSIQTQEENGLILQIHDINKNDEGKYECVGRNNEGESSDAYNLLVEVEVEDTTTIIPNTKRCKLRLCFEFY